MATAEALGHDLESLSISRSTIQRCRQQLRKERVEYIKTRFDKSDLSSAVIHWDGKLLSSITGSEKVERLAVILTSKDKEVLLGVPIIPDGTGTEQANAVFQLLVELDLEDAVKALCCDTTAANTGYINGACTLLEQNLKKELLYFPCRHHIFEIILKGIYDVKMPQSSGPNVPLFKRFREFWPKVIKDNFKSVMELENMPIILHDQKCHILNFIRLTLKMQQPREDYRELLELSALFLERPSSKVTIRVPGAFHHARWMAKGIYALKIFLFRDQFKLTAKEFSGITDICIFIVTTYIKAWFTAPIAVKAPNHDFEFLKQLINYKNVDSAISDIAVNKMLNHLWYLNPQNIALAFFDDEVSLEVKREMIKGMAETETSRNDEGVKRLLFTKDELSILLQKSLPDFVTSSTNIFFRTFHIDTEFLNHEPDSWATNDNFNIAFHIVNKLKVVNDAAEQGIKLITEYNNILTKDEEQKQFLLQIVTDYRRNFPDSKKATVIKSLK
jgi:hypothetical protein